MLFMELTPILTVAAKEFRDRMRNRWVLAVALVFTVFSLVIAYFGGAQQGAVGLRSIEFTIASLVSLVIYLIPLIALLLGFVAFYALGEARVFAHRLVALPQIEKTMADYPDQPLYSIGLADMRLVFYTGRPVKPLHAAQVRERLGEDALLFLREPLPAALADLAPCTRARFAPYLKRGKGALLLVRLGPSCQPASAP